MLHYTEVMRLERLDGLRTIAVGLVILLHHSYAPLGGVGVDLFFVLSGYLITGILRRSRDKERFWGPFYLKRATRILPPVLLLIPIVFVLTRHGKVSSALEYLFFLGGLDIIGKNSLPILANLWSLAVEEHFYLLWPFAIRFLPKAKLKGILLAILIVEPILRLLAVRYAHNPSQVTYFLTPFRLDGLALGSLLAVLLEEWQWEARIKRWSPVLAVSAGALYVGLYLAFPARFNPDSNSALFCGFSYTIISLAMVGLIAYVLLHPEALLSRVLSWRPIVWLGTISYGLYLFGGIIGTIMGKVLHTPSYPIPVALHHKMFFYDVPLIILVSWISFKFYEHPITLWGKQKADGNVRSETLPA